MMNRLDWFVTRRMASRILSTILVFFVLIFLSESLDQWRFNKISAASGEATAWLAILTASIRWSVKTLSVTTLFGAILALVEFQSHREFAIMKASGVSVWRIMRGPIVLMILLGLVVTFSLESVSTRINRDINPTPPGLGGGVARSTDYIWLTQVGDDGPYFMSARGQLERGQVLRNVIVFPNWGSDARTIRADEARFEVGHWKLANATVTRRNGMSVQVEDFSLSTRTSAADLRLTVGSTEDFTYFELMQVLGQGVSDPVLRASAMTRFFKLTSLPLVLVGSLLIAFAFTAGYRRDNTYGSIIIYGIILGFVVFVITEMADRAGSSGVLNPAYATWGPAAVAMLIGISVLLRKEDGRA